MSKKNTLFYRKNQEINFDFSAEEISTDGGIFLAEKIERQYGIIKNFCDQLPDERQSGKVHHSIKRLVKQRVYLMLQGYQDCNDERHLRKDPVISEALDGELAAQPTLSRFENSLSISEIYKMSEDYLSSYVNTISPDRKRIVIDADGTDDPTHGNQQLSMFNGYYKQFMYNELLFHDGETGQIILPVLRPGNCHSSRWFVHILAVIVDKIRAKHPDIEIVIRADAGFSGPNFYKMADDKNLLFCIGMTSNERLKSITKISEDVIRESYLQQGEKYQFFAGAFQYQADTWEKPQNCYAKIESTGKGMNVRYFCSNMENKTANELYWDFYVKRGDASENRIKELKNMCYSGRLSCHKYTANYFRLFLSCLCYEFFRLIKELIKKTGDKTASKWQVDNIRLFLLKVGATIIKRIRRVKICFSKSYVCRELFCKIVAIM
jgi:hypothetical protein